VKIHLTEGNTLACDWLVGVGSYGMPSILEKSRVRLKRQINSLYRQDYKTPISNSFRTILVKFHVSRLPRSRSDTILSAGYPAANQSLTSM
jgi:hypothetical protein